LSSATGGRLDHSMSNRMPRSKYRSYFRTCRRSRTSETQWQTPVATPHEQPPDDGSDGFARSTIAGSGATPPFGNPAAGPYLRRLARSCESGKPTTGNDCADCTARAGRNGDAGSNSPLGLCLTEEMAPSILSDLALDADRFSRIRNTSAI